MTMKQIMILLADDHTIVREGFRKMLEIDGDIKVVGEAKDGRQAVATVKELRPDVVLMDIAMPLLNGLEATRQLIRSDKNAKIIMLSAHGDNAYITEATEAGAMGFLVKQSSAHEVCKAIREVHNGKFFYSASIARRLNRANSRSMIRNGKRYKKSAKLTSREREVLQLIAESKANKEVAWELGIANKTVEKHREHIMEKLDIHDTAGLTRYAISVGIIENSVQLTIL